VKFRSVNGNYDFPSILALLTTSSRISPHGGGRLF
jgi:hypothetical protein